MLSPTSKQNLLRLLRSADIDHQKLALQMLAGMEHSADLLSWLWDCYKKYSQPQARISLQTYPAVPIEQRNWGGVLALLLQHQPAVEEVWASFQYRYSLRIPYNTLHHFPSGMYRYVEELEELVWKDGELNHIPADILRFKKLRHLDLRRQPIVDIHPNIADLPQLEEIHLVSTSFLPDELLERPDVDIYTDAPY